MINGITTPTHLWNEMRWGAFTPLMLTIVFSTSHTQNRKSKTRIVSEVSESNNKSDFLYWQTSIINMGRLKPIIKPFDSGWNYIQHAFIKLMLLLVIWSWEM